MQLRQRQLADDSQIGPARSNRRQGPAGAGSADRARTAPRPRRCGTAGISAAMWLGVMATAGPGAAQETATAPRPAAPPYKLVIDATTATTYWQDKPVLRYRYAGVTFKPYVDLLYTPAGINVLRDSPADHKHHHGLMFAVAVDGLNFWEETSTSGRQMHQSLNDVRTGAGGEVFYAGFAEDIAWVNPQTRAAMLMENRRVELVRMKDQKATLLTWESFIETPPGKKSVTLTGSDYFGLGMRFLASMDAGGKFFNADGKSGVEGTNAAPSRWCAYTASAEGKPVTVAVFNHPGNPRQPGTWFTMTQAFAYISATVALHKEPLTLSEEQPMLFRHGVALWDGSVDAKEVEGLYRKWVELFQPPPGADAPPPASPAVGRPPA